MRKKLEVSVEPANVGQEALKLPIKPTQPNLIQRSSGLMGAFVVFSPAGNVLSQPFHTMGEALALAEQLLQNNQPSVVMTIVREVK
jgi:hypothetical protein